MDTLIKLTMRVDNTPGKISEHILLNPLNITFIMREGEGVRLGLGTGAILPILEDFEFLTKLLAPSQVAKKPRVSKPKKVPKKPSKAKVKRGRRK